MINTIIIILIIVNITVTCLSIAIIGMAVLKLPRKYYCQVRGCKSSFDTLGQLNYHLTYDHSKEDYENYN